MPYKSNSQLMLTLALLGTIPLAAHASTIKVPLNKPTIQSAIDGAVTGDVILVSPGTYFEHIDFHGKAITVEAQRSPIPTIIDGGSTGTVVTFTSGEGLTSVLSGFVIQNGNSGNRAPCYGEGGGMCIEDASPTIEYNTINNNVACEGPGIAVGFGSPLISGNLIKNNSQGGCGGGIGGGGISLRGAASAKIVNNIIESNSTGSDGGGIALFAAGSPMIRGNIIRSNIAGQCGGAISMYNQADATIAQNLVTGNSASCGGGIYWLVPSGDRGPVLVSNTISDTGDAGVYADGFDIQSRLVNNIIVASAGKTALYCGNFNDTNPPIIQFNDIYSQSGSAYGGYCKDKTGQSGNISADPLFKQPSSQNYHILAGSPAIDAGRNDAPSMSTVDVDGAARIQNGNGGAKTKVDMGIDEFTSSVPTAALATMDDGAHRSAPVVVAKNRSGDRFHKTGLDSRRTVIAVDADGSPMTQTDANGTRHRLK